MGRSPNGVAIGVSGEAQTGQTSESVQCQTPLVHTAIVSWQAVCGQAIPGESHAAPAFGTIDGQGDDGISALRHDQAGEPSGCPVGHSAHGGPGTCGVTQLHGTQAQSEVSSLDTHTSDVSLQVVPSAVEPAQPGGRAVQ